MINFDKLEEAALRRLHENFDESDDFEMTDYDYDYENSLPEDERHISYDDEDYLADTFATRRPEKQIFDQEVDVYGYGPDYYEQEGDGPLEWKSTEAAYADNIKGGDIAPEDPETGIPKGGEFDTDDFRKMDYTEANKNFIADSPKLGIKPFYYDGNYDD